ncbi:MAG: dTDP-4-dehydrorhamnose 3,5-epimerase [Bacteroidales bacterium]|jgi:dTDP-4-dehydrorhamnose 3,5-epimerase|nr:dTDP-4-dehydrorhamnose 3,5-epimerase [Bacteroidales bacterium]NLM93347.1 dTDP-4-dehydrorhamnose 3,5-epimerase [Bacteroidales bacterium]
MQITETPFRGLLIIQPAVFRDKRGYFFESWNEENFLKKGLDIRFAQDNQSSSQKGVLRGLHFQVPPYEQGKLVRAIRGAVMDVAVDLRREEATFGQHFKLRLDDRDHTMLYIPPGFAHGFVTLEDHTVFVYKCTKVYNKDCEKVLRWDDPDLAIDWEVSDPILSEKDSNAGFFKELASPFL